ncbi:hypothetical protein BDZ89DRAFT_1048542 [Hymenopellis radicata]|nr:hypothetical protein BDZ89DRAFT_1048542 [Hymenopellis radicata]
MLGVGDGKQIRTGKDTDGIIMMIRDWSRFTTLSELPNTWWIQCRLESVQRASYSHFLRKYSPWISASRYRQSHPFVFKRVSVIRERVYALPAVKKDLDIFHKLISTWGDEPSVLPQTDSMTTRAKEWQDVHISGCFGLNAMQHIPWRTASRRSMQLLLARKQLPKSLENLPSSLTMLKLGFSVGTLRMQAPSYYGFLASRNFKYYPGADVREFTERDASITDCTIRFELDMPNLADLTLTFILTAPKGTLRFPTLLTDTSGLDLKDHWKTVGEVKYTVWTTRPIENATPISTVEYDGVNRSDDLDTDADRPVRPDLDEPDSQPNIHFFLIRCGAPSHPTRSIRTWINRLTSSPVLASYIGRVIIMAPLTEPPESLAELIQLCTRHSDLQSLTLAGIDLKPLIDTPLCNTIFGHTSSLILEDVVIEPDKLILLMTAAKTINALELDSNCLALGDILSQTLTAHIPPPAHVCPNVTSLSIGLTENSCRRDLFRILHLLHQAASWTIHTAHFDVGSESSASVTPLVASIAPTVKHLKLTLNSCLSPGHVLSQFIHLTAVSELSLAITEPTIPRLTNALLSLPNHSELTRLRLEISLEIQLQRNDWLALGHCIASRHWIAIMDVQSLFIRMPTPAAFLRWQTEAFTVRRLLNENDYAGPRESHLGAQPLLPFPPQARYYPPRLNEHDELSTRQMSDMMTQDTSIPKNSSVKQYVQDAYSSHSTSRVRYIYEITQIARRTIYAAICPIQEFHSLNLKNDIASSYLRSITSRYDGPFEIWTGNVVIWQSRGGILTDMSDADLPIVDDRLPRFLRWYMREGRFED